MAPARVWERNVRPKCRADDVLSEEEGLDESLDEGSEDDAVESGPEDGDSEDEGDVQQHFTNVSFGALKQAQDVLSRKRKRDSDTNDDQEDKLEALRRRLRQIKEEKAGKSADKPRSTTVDRDTQARVSVTKDKNNEDDDEEDADSDSAPSEEGAPASRTSKHAPAALSTRHQVTRKRQVIDLPKRTVRDPRFDALHSHNHQGTNTEKAYSFLRDYQKSEIAELKTALKKTKSEEDKEILRRKVNSMENRIKTKEAKEREQEVLRKHRKEEKVRVGEGKTPFYLKKKDLKERTLVEKFKGMKGKEREKIVEKRRKKESQRERRMMPTDRRAVG